MELGAGSEVGTVAALYLVGHGEQWTAFGQGSEGITLGVGGSPGVPGG